MSRYALAIALCAGLVAVAPSFAEVRLVDVTADGTWDCTDKTGAKAGTVVLAEKTYAFIKTDRKLGGYGKLWMITENFDLPHFTVMSGYLKDDLASFGLGMRGPRDHPHDLSGELFLTVILSADGKGADDWECVRRGGRG